MASNRGLYHPSFERDSCGIGFVANIKGHKSHQHIADALTILENREHRGACGCEVNTGDGVGMIFFPRDIRLREECRDIFNRAAEKLRLEILGYRKVPVNAEGIGATA